MKASHRKSITVLSFDGERVCAVAGRCVGRGIRVERCLDARLSLDVLAADPELVGHEVRELLVQGRIRERHCLVCLPAEWVMSLAVDITAVPAEDVASYLELQAERELFHAAQDLSIATSSFVGESGERLALVLAVPRAHVQRLSAVLKAARLRPLGFTLGGVCTAQSAASAETPELALVLGESGADLVLTGGGAVMAVRRLDPVTGRAPDGGTLERQLRISIAQLPHSAASPVETLRVFGGASVADTVVKSLQRGVIGEQLRCEEGPGPDSVTLSGDCQTAWRAGRAVGAVCAASVYLRGRSSLLQFSSESPRSARRRGGAAGSRAALRWALAGSVLLAVLIGLFARQLWRLSQLEAEWRAVQPTVTRIQGLRESVRNLSPWFTEEPLGLSILALITKTFPEEGSVWATKVLIKDSSEVLVSGKARDRDAWLRVQERLRSSLGVHNLRILHTRDAPDGETPMTFTLTFAWQDHRPGRDA